jgi:hypothetical protein
VTQLLGRDADDVPGLLLSEVKGSDAQLSCCSQRENLGGSTHKTERRQWLTLHPVQSLVCPPFEPRRPPIARTAPRRPGIRAAPDRQVPRILPARARQARPVPVRKGLPGRTGRRSTTATPASTLDHRFCSCYVPEKGRSRKEVRWTAGRLFLRGPAFAGGVR